jgi:phosphate transport system ATP-binding protein
LADSIAVDVRDYCLWYGTFQALHSVDLHVTHGEITAMIGPSGCGKSTLLRAINRINERFETVRTSGSIHVLGHDVYDPSVELVQVRKNIGMVFQRPNPLPLSIRDNVLFGHRLHYDGPKQSRAEIDDLVEQTLQTVLLWDKVKDRLKSSANALSLEEQQKLCIARLLPQKPAVLLMDEPCSALDPNGTEAVEEMIWRLRGDYTIVLVTHNMAQARRASDTTVFMLLGKIVEHTNTGTMFVSPTDPQTADYIEGKYG